MQVAIVVFGSREPMFFDYDVVDGFRWVRIVSFVSPNIVFSSTFSWTTLPLLA